MITLIEALNYRCLRYVSRPLDAFHVLVGSNASGKTTFLDVVGFLRDVASEGLDTALNNRSSNPEDLLFGRQGESMELAIEAAIPQELRKLISKPHLDTMRYEILCLLTCPTYMVSILLKSLRKAFTRVQFPLYMTRCLLCIRRKCS